MQQLCLPLQYSRGRGFDDFWGHAKNAELLHQLKNSSFQAGPFLLYIWGNQASGKSHLLEAFCRESHEAGLRAGYVDFSAAQSLSVDILDGLDALDCVCFDNIHVLDSLNFESFQLALFRLFNNMRDNNRTMLFSSLVPIAQFRFMLPDLVSRLQWGLSYQLHSFQVDHRAFLLWSAQRRGMVLSESSADYILRYFARDERSLLNLLDVLETKSLREQRKLTIPFIRRVMKQPKERLF